MPHELAGDTIMLKDDEAKIFSYLLFRKPIQLDKTLSVPEIISISSGIKIRPKFSTAVGVRVGRPEKASLRKMKPPVHTLFPVGSKGGASRDLLKAIKQPNFYCNINNRMCKNCNLPSISIICQRCKTKTVVTFVCPKCRDELRRGSLPQV